MGDVTALILGCGDEDPGRLHLGDVLGFPLGGEDPEKLSLKGVLHFTSGSGDDSERLCLCGGVYCSLAWGLVTDSRLGEVPDFTLG